MVVFIEEPIQYLHSAPVNWSSFLKQVKIDYETPPARGISHGLQKDAIQNGWGARTLNKGQNWSFNFSIIKGPEYLFLTMTDGGTTGLIGKIYDHATSMDLLPDEIPPDQKLARFECMFDSGGGQGPGLFGRGKLLFNVASKKHLIYYESFTVDEKYRFGKRHIIGRNCEQFTKTLEGDIALQKFREVTLNVLQPLNRPGTRIIIIDPIKEVVDDFHNGNFLKFIEETWWEIIIKYNAEITITDELGNNFKAGLPKDYCSLPPKDTDGWRVYKIDNLPIETKSESLGKIKHLHLLLPPTDHIIPEALRGLNVHRKGMKIGPLPITGIPDEISDRFFGYIQLDEEYEEFLSESLVESITHYGFSSRNKPAYKYLKESAQEHVDRFMQTLGYRKASKDPNEEIKRVLEEARSDLDSILSGMGVTGFGMGQEEEPGISILLKDLKFPEDRSYAKIGEKISNFWYSIVNSLLQPKTVQIKVYTYEQSVGQIESLFEQKIKLNPNKEYKTPFLELNIKNELYPIGKKVICVGCVLDENEKILASKKFYVYIDVESPREERFAKIILKSATWPREDIRRVDYNQSIQNLTYEIENLTPIIMKLRLKIRTLWAVEKDPVDNVHEADFELGPFESKTVNIEKIVFSKEKYSRIRRGKILLRCHAAALETTKQWERATRLDEHNIFLYLNMDPSYGFFDDPSYFDGGSISPRSEAQPLEGNRLWEFRINSTHPAFLETQATGEEDKLKNYCVEEMARQTIFVLLRKDQMDSIAKLANLDQDFDISSKDPHEILQLIAYPATDKIIAKYYGG